MANLVTQKDSGRAAHQQAQQGEDSRVYTSLAHLVGLSHQASGFSFLPRQPLSSLLAGRHAAKIRGRGLNFEEIRAYLPGDDIRSIDWKVTARARKPHVRVYTEERERQAFLLVDQRMSMFFGGSSPSSGARGGKMSAQATGHSIRALSCRAEVSMYSPR